MYFLPLLTLAALIQTPPHGSQRRAPKAPEAASQPMPLDASAAAKPLAKPKPTAQTRAAQGLVEAELAFSKKADQDGTAAAFQDVLDDLGVLFRPGPVNGKTWLARQQPDGSKLTWYPSLVEVSAAGDLGYSTGPYQWRAAANSKQVSHGHFVSVWGRCGTSWRLLLDIGSSHPAPGEEDPVFEPENGKDAWQAEPLPPFSPEALQALETAFSNAASARGILSAYNTYLAADAYFYRTGCQPTTQVDDIRKALEKLDRNVTWTCLGSAVAKSHDLGYAYGIREYKPNPATMPKPETMRKQAPRTFTFLHIWKRQQSGRWKVILDIENPMS